ncbi:hypothetical protein I3271_05445 [Photobacterium leiognathi]|uniref:hypothetical protein n=1 Tax=Photobacterium leiognathi TaxID=553611 RepID=UPI001EE10860|nr:hypothetical protein [Photobacterium leiognathi]MCG3884125.1 hypothetical protein [Photobacterium leiognathi]
MLDIKEKLLTYFVYTEKVGHAERAISAIASGKPVSEKACYERELTALNRFIVLLHSVPELREFIPQMAVINEDWKRVSEHWSVIEKMFIDEAGIGFTKRVSAPQTYHYIQALLR